MQNSKRYRKLKNKTGKNKLVKIYGVKKQLYVMIKTRKLYVISKGKMMKLSKYKAMKKTANSKKKQVKRKTVKRAPAKKKTVKKKKTAGYYGEFNNQENGPVRKSQQIMALYNPALEGRYQGEMMRFFIKNIVNDRSQAGVETERTLRFQTEQIRDNDGEGKMNFGYSDAVIEGARAIYRAGGYMGFYNQQMHLKQVEEMEASMSSMNIRGLQVPYPFK